MRRAGRRPGQTETRDQIVEAARRLFAEQGYGGATIRGIAAEAGVNPALLHHFFGTKQQLFVAAMNLPINPEDIIPRLLDGPRDTIGERLVRTFLGFWADPDGRAPFLALLRSVTNNAEAAAMLRNFLDQAVLARLADALGIPRVRLAGAVAQMMGVALLRYIVEIPPLAAATDDDIVTMVAPVIQYYVDNTS
jgi:AcrR family transcriptional regulator